MSAAWDNYHGGTVVARHEYKGLSKMAYSLEDHVERERLEREERSSSQRRRIYRRVPGAYLSEGFSDLDDDDEN